MDVQTMERWLLTALATGVALLGAKFGLNASQIAMAVGVLTGAMAIPAVHQGMDKLLASKGGQDLGALLGGLAKAKAALDQAKATMAQAGGAAAGAAAAAPSPGGPSQA